MQLNSLQAAVTELSTNVTLLIAQQSPGFNQSDIDTITSEVNTLNDAVVGALAPTTPPPATPTAPVPEATAVSSTDSSTLPPHLQGSGQ